ncbi:MAG: bifunctional hydroxymethylpyrimidine kinase/phosphomethylpyrimidine kinase [Thermoleophilia bacterium]|nr:bifunctional hydroxymethylpyrimidine kinase/phosphomethylpyrimidine kinase [Thermoleophilia bacterium]
MAKRGADIALTIAGSDSGGGAGLQADLRAFGHVGVYGMSVVTAITAQNTSAVIEIFPAPAKQVRSQLSAVLSDMEPAATKTGMLATAEIVKEVAFQAKARRLGRLVVDPVLGSTSGQALAEEGLERELVTELLPLAELITPNTREAARLTGVEISNTEDAREAALALTEMSARAVCVTGGHLPGDPVDILFDGRNFYELTGRRLGGAGIRFHGTGCFFSAAITAYLARGMDLRGSVEAGKRLVEAAIAKAIAPGSGMPVPWLKAASDETEDQTA